MAKKINLIVWSVFTAALAVISILHPRANNILAALVSAGILIYFSRDLKNKIYKDIFSEKTKTYLKTFPFALVVGAVWLFGSFFNLFFPIYPKYEYKGEMALLKDEHYEHYFFFPDTVPKEADRVTFKRMPSFLQGSGFDCLFLRINKEYINSIVDEYSSQGTVKAFSNAGSIPGASYIPSEDKASTKVIILYDNNDWNHHRIDGIYYNTEAGFICFFSQ